MTPAQLASYVRYKTKTDSVSFTDAEILVIANIEKDDMAKEVLKADENYFGFKTYQSLEANKRNYAFDPATLSKMDYLYAKLDGTNWKKLREYELHQLGKEDMIFEEAQILTGMAGKKPGFVIYGGEIYIMSDSAITDVTDGLKLWYRLYPVDISDLTSTTDMSVRPSTTSDGFPRQLHKLLATKIIISYKESQEKPIPLTESEKNFENDLEKAINSLKNQNSDREVVPSYPYDDGQNY
jgi:hypothetical protein